MLQPIDRFLNAITMYRLTLGGLGLLAVVGIALGFAGALPYTGVHLAASALLLGAVCYAANALLARLFRAPSNMESSAITALILFFVFAPATTPREAATLALAAVVAMGSKYAFATGKRHLFNPAAFAAVALTAAGGYMALWWVGSSVMLLPTLIVGAALVRKTRRFDAVAAFLAAVAATLAIAPPMPGMSYTELVAQLVQSWPLVFFATIMLTEPLTLPPTRNLRLVYGALVGILFASRYHVGPFFSSPELALIVGNVFAYAVGHRHRLLLTLRGKRELAPGIVEFVFAPSRPLQFVPGQYLEWTLAHAQPDTRGVRRFFTVASAPSEPEVRLAVRMGKEMSSYKRALNAMPIGGSLTASHRCGDFVLPKNAATKLAFVAGGIGITPFRSMLRHLADTGERRDIVLFYACMSSADFAYLDEFRALADAVGLRIVCVVTDATKAGEGYNGRTGFIDATMLQEEAPDFAERAFYLSGPSGMVDAYKALLRASGVRRSRIITDYFPGF